MHAQQPAFRHAHARVRAQHDVADAARRAEQQRLVAQGVFQPLGADAARIAAEIEKVSLTIPMKVGEDDKLFGSVTSQMIADALAEKGFTIDKRHIELEEPIRTLGIFEIPVKIHSKVAGKAKVWVVRE